MDQQLRFCFTMHKELMSLYVTLFAGGQPCRGRCHDTELVYAADFPAGTFQPQGPCIARGADSDSKAEQARGPEERNQSGK